MSKWELVNINEGDQVTQRLKVEGGYLYLRIDLGGDGEFSNTMCFVPWEHKEELKGCCK